MRKSSSKCMSRMDKILWVVDIEKNILTKDHYMIISEWEQNIIMEMCKCIKLLCPSTWHILSLATVSHHHTYCYWIWGNIDRLGWGTSVIRGGAQMNGWMGGSFNILLSSYILWSNIIWQKDGSWLVGNLS